MGMLINGKWSNEPPPPSDGRFARVESRFRHRVTGYYSSERVNPNGIIPALPALDFGQPHDRAAVAAVSA